MRKLNKAGFTHHFILLLIVMISVAGLGAYRIIKATAQTEQMSYDSHVTIRVTGNGGHAVSMKTSNHTLGLCNPKYETISVSSSKVCDGNSMGTTDGLTLYVSSAPSGYKFSSWIVSSDNTHGSVSCGSTCKINFDAGSVTVTASFTTSTSTPAPPPPPPTPKSDSYLTINMVGNDKHSATFKTTGHTLGSCNPSGDTFTVTTSKKCSGFALGYPERLILSVAKAPDGYSFTGWHVYSSQKVTQGTEMYCNTTCSVNIGAGTATVSANFKKTPKPASGSSGGWVWPLPASHNVSNGWGASTSKGLHKGIDIGDSPHGNLGAKVIAAHSGEVEYSADNGACGWFVRVKTNIPVPGSSYNYRYAYQHLDPKKPHAALAGTAKDPKPNPIEAGALIGYVGTAGGSSCGTAGFYHLHFSVEKGPWISVYADPLSKSADPLDFL